MADQSDILRTWVTAWSDAIGNHTSFDNSPLDEYGNPVGLEMEYTVERSADGEEFLVDMVVADGTGQVFYPGYEVNVPHTGDGCFSLKGSLQYTKYTIPEPGSSLLALIGLTILSGRRRRS